MRVVKIDGEPWFVVKDVAAVLGYSNTREAVAKYTDEDDRNTVALRDGNRGNPNQVVINESGLYSLILTSPKGEAKRFKKWVTGTVLPAIRKDGAYIMGEEKASFRLGLPLRAPCCPAWLANSCHAATGPRIGTTCAPRFSLSRWSAHSCIIVRRSGRYSAKL